MIIIGFLGSLLYYVAVLVFMVLYTPICTIVWIVTTPFDKLRRVSNRMNGLIGYMLTFLNPFWRTQIHGVEKVDKNETYVYAPNHQSMTDICMLASTFLDMKWVSKKELTFVPLLGWMMSYAKYILLDRKDPKSQFKMMRNCEFYLNNGVSISIFPEGTRSPNGEMGKFRDGASLLARKTNTKIVPVCNHGNYLAMPKKGLIFKKKIEMNMYILDPIDPADYKTKELSNMVKAAIQNKLDELNSIK